MTKKKFTIATIISGVYGTLLTNVANLYTLYNYMTGDNLFTHQLPRALTVCAPYILKELPQLENFRNHIAEITPENYTAYIIKATEMFGYELEISSLPEGVWEHKDAVAEMLEKMNKKESREENNV